MMDAPRDPRRLSHHDQAMANLGPERFQVLPRVAIAELTGVGVPPRIDLSHFANKYKELGKAPLSVLKSTKKDPKEYVVVGPPIGPEELLATLDCVSPDKGIKANSHEILSHWDILMGRPELLEAHEIEIPGWADFIKSGKAAVDFLGRNYEPRTHKVVHKDPKDLLRPVFRWRVDEHGNRSIDLKPFTEKEKQEIADALPEESISLSQLNENAGIAYLAAFSPIITKEWKSFSPYHPKDENTSNGARQDIDFIQALAFVYRMIGARQQNAAYVPDNQDLQGSSLFLDFERYAENGVPPTYDPLQAIRRNVLDFFAGYDFTQQAVVTPLTTQDATISICSQGNPDIHRAISADGLSVTLSYDSNRIGERIATGYELMREDFRSQIRLQLTDQNYYTDEPSQIKATRLSYETHQTTDIDLTTPEGKEIIKDIFDITLA